MKMKSSLCYNILGILYHICKDYGKSKSYFNKYAENAKLMNDSVRMVLALNNKVHITLTAVSGGRRLQQGQRQDSYTEAGTFRHSKDYPDRHGLRKGHR